MPATAEPDILSLFSPGRFEYAPAEPMSEDEFFDLCQRADPRIHFVSNALLMAKLSSCRLLEATARTGATKSALNFATGLVEPTGVSNLIRVGGFTLPNGATRAPDAAWVSSDQLTTLSKEEKEKFLPLAPDFAVEVRPQNDRREDLEAKMTEYVENGTRLGWLVDPYDETVTIYRDDGTVEEHEKPDTLSGAPVLPGFTCNFERVWNPSY